MSETIVTNCTQISLVFNFPYYFYTRTGGADDATRSISATEAKRIYTAVTDGGERIVIEGEPRFDTSGPPWAVSALIIEEAANGSQ